MNILTFPLLVFLLNTEAILQSKVIKKDVIEQYNDTILQRILKRMDNMDKKMDNIDITIGQAVNRVKSNELKIEKLIQTSQKLIEFDKNIFRGISIEDVEWLMNKTFANCLDFNGFLLEFQNIMDGFEETYGSGSMKNFVQVLHQVDDMEKRKDIWSGSIKRILAQGTLKFVESPKNTTLILGEFGKEADGRLYVTGYTNIKVDSDAEWHPFFHYSTWAPHQYFGNNEANVTCKQSGYTSGLFVKYENWIVPHPYLKYVEVQQCTGKEERLTDCPSYHVFYYNHWLTNVQLKCYI